ncbi:acyl-CoA synthetase [Allostella sp. ATCC 35155]|nr:acyl-CoA synthetase [Stella sp. ATCC 35155]
MVNYLDGLLGHAARRPDEPALSLPDRTLSRAELAASLAGVSAGLAARGVPAGGVVAIAARGQAACLRAILGTILGGRVALPIDPAAVPADLDRLLAQSGAAAILADGWEALPSGRPVIALGELPAMADPAAVRHAGGDHWAQIVVSSGTTGPSKAAPASHAQMLQRTRVLVPLLGLGADDRYLPLIDLAYALGRHSAVRVLDVGGAVVLRPLPATVPQLLALLRAERITYLSLTPTHVRAVLDGMDEAEPALPAMRALSVSGSALPLADRLDVRRRLTPGLHISYGSNEMGFATHAGPAELDLAPACVGRALAGIRVEIVDDARATVAAGTIGEIRVAGAQMHDAYLGGDASGHRDGWFHPGDTGWLDAHGLLHLAGRTDDRINFGSNKVYPFEVEAVLRTHPAIADCAVFGVPSRQHQEVVAAAVVLSAATTTGELRAHCRARLARSKIPALFLLLDRLPRNATGKVLVRRLREQLSGKAS